MKIDLWTEPAVVGPKLKDRMFGLWVGLAYQQGLHFEGAICLFISLDILRSVALGGVAGFGSLMNLCATWSPSNG
jgi:hypothetical protein